MAIKATHLDTTFHVGDTIEVYYKIIEKETVAGKAKREVKEEIRERTQSFTGIVLSMRGEGMNKSFTVRRIGSAGVGVERIYPLFSPWIKKIAVVKQARVRRAKLYYLRHKLGKEAEVLKDKVISNVVHKKKKKSTQKKTSRRKQNKK